MASADWQLEPGERLLFQTRLHPLAFSGAASLMLFIAVVVALLIAHNDLPLRIEVQIALAGAAVAIVGAFPSALRWRNTNLGVTDRRFLLHAGGLRPRHLAVPLAPGMVDYDAGLTGRLFDHGTVTVAGPDGHLSSIGHVARARELVEVARAQARRASRRRT
jgi:membrane protein YdbS with pleckstrin-like domain